MFDSHSYNKGALVLHMFRFLLGEEGWWKGSAPTWSASPDRR